MTTAAAWLLAGLFLAHFLGDFTPLATDRMQVAKASGGPLSLIAGHAAVHTVLVALAIGIAVGLGFPVQSAWTVVAAAAAIEFVTHFAIDALRAQLSRRSLHYHDPGERRFWVALGLDQLAHGLVLVGLAALVL